MTGDLASEMVDGIDRFLRDEIDASIADRANHWSYDFSSTDAFNQSIVENRQRLAYILGVREQREKFDAPELLATTSRPALVAETDTVDVFAIRWPVLKGIHGEGLLLVPRDGKVSANVVVVPDADQTPEQIAGLSPGLESQSQVALRLAAAGCRVIVPTLISREIEARGAPGHAKRAKVTNREYIYRAAFDLGRHVIGYELQKVFACIDWFSKDAGVDAEIGVVGYGEGGMLALYAGALDSRIDRVLVSGYFGPRERIWEEPLARNVFGRLDQFGDAELATMIWPRRCIIEHAKAPEVVLPTEGGAPGAISTPSAEEIKGEIQRAVRHEHIEFGPEESPKSFGSVLDQFFLELTVPSSENTLRILQPADAASQQERQQRQLAELIDYTQQLIPESHFVRQEFMKELETNSLTEHEARVEEYREIFRHDVIGHFDHDLLPFNARTRRTWDEPEWTGYEVMLDVFPDVFAYGVLLLPKDLPPDERRPVVVCQHGLEGRPTDLFGMEHRAYKDFASELCKNGYIVFCPQNPYLFQDRFRTLQRKSNAIGKTLFSTIVPQHQQILNWLKTQPNVDPQRIAFYGLSYGGKSAMRIPALVTDYCLSICSGDFNEWVLKNASTRHKFSYVWTGEYEIWEFDLGSTFNYAEMAALICPRPFMVERGHFDGVGDDEWVAFEYAKVRNRYQAKLGIGDRTEIEWFVGPHAINGEGTFRFLDQHLRPGR
ncbi:dienelactone hydrolase family protein [Rubinisphaera margarita]|uniref:dienelactone hydrolase family protein n=1 Tax=Rubinisphaera margarita TaxID=2909586 RepID=UPI001EE8E1A8|nr:dienelactone hydrolase family protein [Rubinisphaera margarita]MCG6156570.1 dienelactone hydrolase family protein [Rubinisphaera margarita]